MTPQSLNGSMTVDDPMVQRYDQRSPHLARQFDDAMDEYYNNKMSEKSYNVDRKINSKRYPL